MGQNLPAKLCKTRSSECYKYLLLNQRVVFFNRIDEWVSKWVDDYAAWGQIRIALIINDLEPLEKNLQTFIEFFKAKLVSAFVRFLSSSILYHAYSFRIKILMVKTIDCLQLYFAMIWDCAEILPRPYMRECRREELPLLNFSERELKLSNKFIVLSNTMLWWRVHQ